jgi:carboxypeptidase PM20D1
VNFRLLPGDTAETVVAHAKSAIGDDAVRVAPGTYNQASAISPTDSDAYRLLARTIREVFTGTLVAPGLMLGATDSRHMAGLSDDIFRFSPVIARPEDLGRFHGTNERISVENFAAMVAFYHRLITNSGSEP